MGMGMLNYCVLSFCPVNEQDGRVGGVESEKERGRWGGRQLGSETGKKSIVKEMLFLGNKIQ